MQQGDPPLARRAAECRILQQQVGHRQSDKGDAVRRQLAQDRHRLFVAAGGQRAAVAAADMPGKRVAGEMVRQPGQPLRHLAELLINMQIQIQIPAGGAIQQVCHSGSVPVGGVDEAAQQAALPAVGDRSGNSPGVRRIAKQGQRDQRHSLQGDAAGIEAGDLLPCVGCVGGKPVDMAA